MWRLICLEKRRCHLVHCFVGALRREHDRHHELEWRPVHELALRDWIRFLQVRNDFLRTHQTLFLFRGSHQTSSFRSVMTCTACCSGFTFSYTFAISPEGSMRNDVRLVPI